MSVPKLFILGLLLSSNLFAQDIKLVGTIEQTIKIPQGHLSVAKPEKQTVKLIKMELSKNAIDILHKRVNATFKKSNLTVSTNGKNKAALGMNNVPVFNQGIHASCVTFSITAAIDAALNKGDYVSQVCQLQLGSYLEKNGYSKSGWDGFNGRLSLSRMEDYGIVSKEKQRTIGCGGLTEYPMAVMPNPDSAMTLEEFHQVSEPLFGENDNDNRIIWSPILDLFNGTIERTDTNNTLADVKEAINQGDRLTFGVLLVDGDLGVLGAVGNHNATFDSWVLTPEIARDIFIRPIFAGHQMIITGYDDGAVAIDDKGRQYKGLLTLRNSMGDRVGDKGDFYMSYDYFKVLVLDVQRIRILPK